MNEKEKIGGRAYSNGLRLKNKSKSVKVYYDQYNNLKVESKYVKSNKFLKYIKYIPIIRGVVTLFFAVFSFLKEVFKEPKKYWFVFLIIFVDLIYLLLPESKNLAFNNIFLVLYIAIPIFLLIKFRNNVSEVLKFHGAEHKAVNYYENDYEGDIGSYSRIHRRCGSNIVFYYLILSTLGSFVNISLNLFLKEIIILGLAFELLKLTPDKLLIIPAVFQKLVTREPDQRQLKAAELALNVLVSNNS